MFEILKKAVTIDGVNIQLEKWDKWGLIIGAYPIAKNYSKYKIIKRGESFRMSIDENKYKNIDGSKILEIWRELAEGGKVLKDFNEFVSDKKYLYYLGIIDTEPYI